MFVPVHGARQVANVEEVTEMREYMGQIPNDLSRLQQEVDENVELCELVESYGYKLTDEIRDLRSAGVDIL